MNFVSTFLGIYWLEYKFSAGNVTVMASPSTSFNFGHSLTLVSSFSERLTLEFPVELREIINEDADIALFGCRTNEGPNCHSKST